MQYRSRGSRQAPLPPNHGRTHVAERVASPTLNPSTAPYCCTAVTMHPMPCAAAAPPHGVLGGRPALPRPAPSQRRASRANNAQPHASSAQQRSPATLAAASAGSQRLARPSPALPGPRPDAAPRCRRGHGFSGDALAATHSIIRPHMHVVNQLHPPPPGSPPAPAMGGCTIPSQHHPVGPNAISP